MKRKAIEFTPHARADLRAIDQATAMRILEALARYLADGTGDVKRLQDVQPPENRLRVGVYRVRFYEYEDRVQILTVKHRREAYR